MKSFSEFLTEAPLPPAPPPTGDPSAAGGLPSSPSGLGGLGGGLGGGMPPMGGGGGGLGGGMGGGLGGPPMGGPGGMESPQQKPLKAKTVDARDVFKILKNYVETMPQQKLPQKKNVEPKRKSLMS